MSMYADKYCDGAGFRVNKDFHLVLRVRGCEGVKVLTVVEEELNDDGDSVGVSGCQRESGRERVGAGVDVRR